MKSLRLYDKRTEMLKLLGGSLVFTLICTFTLIHFSWVFGTIGVLFFGTGVVVGFYGSFLKKPKFILRKDTLSVNVEGKIERIEWDEIAEISQHGSKSKKALVVSIRSTSEPIEGLPDVSRYIHVEYEDLDADLSKLSDFLNRVLKTPSESRMEVVMKRPPRDMGLRPISSQEVLHHIFALLGLTFITAIPLAGPFIVLGILWVAALIYKWGTSASEESGTHYWARVLSNCALIIMAIFAIFSF